LFNADKKIITRAQQRNLIMSKNEVIEKLKKELFVPSVKESEGQIIVELDGREKWFCHVNDFWLVTDEDIINWSKKQRI